MPNEPPLPDDMHRLNDKRGGKDRRKKSQGRFSDEEDGGAVRRPGPAGQKDRRSQKNYRDLLNDDDE